MPVNDKRWKILNGIRMRCTPDTTGRRTPIHSTHTHVRCHNNRTDAASLSSSRSLDDDPTVAIPSQTGIYLQGKLLCDYKFRFQQLSDEKHKQKLWHENNNNNNFHRQIFRRYMQCSDVRNAWHHMHSVFIIVFWLAAAASCLVLSHHITHIYCIYMHFKCNYHHLH